MLRPRSPVAGSDSGRWTTWPMASTDPIAAGDGICVGVDVRPAAQQPSGQAIGHRPELASSSHPAETTRALRVSPMTSAARSAPFRRTITTTAASTTDTPSTTAASQLVTGRIAILHANGQVRPSPPTHQARAQPTSEVNAPEGLRHLFSGPFSSTRPSHERSHGHRQGHGRQAAYDQECPPPRRQPCWTGVGAPHSSSTPATSSPTAPAANATHLAQAHDLRPLGCDFGRSLRDGLLRSASKPVSTVQLVIRAPSTDPTFRTGPDILGPLEPDVWITASVPGER